MEEIPKISGDIHSSTFSKYQTVNNNWSPGATTTIHEVTVPGLHWEALTLEVATNSTLSPPAERLQQELEAIQNHTDDLHPPLIIASHNYAITRKMAVEIATAMSSGHPIVFSEPLIRISKVKNSGKPLEIQNRAQFSSDVPPDVKAIISRYFLLYERFVIPPSRLAQTTYDEARATFIAPSLEEHEKEQVSMAARQLVQDYGDHFRDHFAGIVETATSSTAWMKENATSTAYDLNLEANPWIIRRSKGYQVLSDTDNQPITDLGQEYQDKALPDTSFRRGKTRLEYDKTAQGSTNRTKNLKRELRQQLGLDESDELYVRRTEDGVPIDLQTISYENGVRIVYDDEGKPHAMDYPVVTIQANINGHVMTVIQEGRMLELLWEAYLLSKDSNFTQPVGHHTVEILQKRYEITHPSVKLHPQDVQTALYGIPHKVANLREQLLLETVLAGIDRLRDPASRRKLREDNPSGHGRQTFEPIYIGHEGPVNEVQVKVLMSEREVEALTARLNEAGYVFSEEVRQIDQIFVERDQPFPPITGSTTHRIRETITQNGETTYTYTPKTVRNAELMKTSHTSGLADKHAADQMISAWSLPERGYRHMVTVDKKRVEAKLGEASIRIDRVNGLDGVFVEIERRANIVEDKVLETQILFLFRSLGLGGAPRIHKGFDTLVYQKQLCQTDTMVPVA